MTEADLTLHRVAGSDLTAAQLDRILRLRAEVFVVEQACCYLDPDGRDVDPATTHLWLAEGDAIASYLRLLPEPGAGHRIGRVVTAADRRGKRLSGRLLVAALAIAERPVVLHAQSHLVGLYAAHGFEVDGAELLDDGIPHTPMRLG